MVVFIGHCVQAHKGHHINKFEKYFSKTRTQLYYTEYYFIAITLFIFRVQIMDKEYLAAQEEWNAVASVTVAVNNSEEYRQGRTSADASVTFGYNP